MSKQTQGPKIVVAKDGPYLVYGEPIVVRKKQISSEHGEPMTWQTNQAVETGNRPVIALCRCGASANKPFCDGTHAAIEFDGTETAATNTFEERKIVHEGSTGIVIKRDYSLCAESGFCGHRFANIQKLAQQTDDSIVRAQVMATSVAHLVHTPMRFLKIRRILSPTCPSKSP